MNRLEKFGHIFETEPHIDIGIDKNGRLKETISDYIDFFIDGQKVGSYSQNIKDSILLEIQRFSENHHFYTTEELNSPNFDLIWGI